MNGLGIIFSNFRIANYFIFFIHTTFTTVDQKEWNSKRASVVFEGYAVEMKGATNLASFQLQGCVEIAMRRCPVSMAIQIMPWLGS